VSALCGALASPSHQGEVVEADTAGGHPSHKTSGDLLCPESTGKKMLSKRRRHPRCAIVRALRAAPPRLKLTNPRPHAPHPSFLVALGVPGFPAAYD
jgi:hypothetical protein